MKYYKNKVKNISFHFFILRLNKDVYSVTLEKFRNIFKALSMYITDWTAALLGIYPNKIKLVCTDAYHHINLMGDNMRAT